MTDHFDGTDAFLQRNGWQPMGGDWWKHAKHGNLSKNDAIGFANKDARAAEATPSTLTAVAEVAVLVTRHGSATQQQAWKIVVNELQRLANAEQT